MWSAISRIWRRWRKFASRKHDVLVAIRENDIATVEQAFAHGLSADATASGDSLFAAAVALDRPKIVALFLKQSPDFRRRSHRRLLVDATLTGNKEVILLGIKNGLDINKCPKSCYSPLETAALECDLEMIDFLVEHGARVDRIKLWPWIKVPSDALLRLEKWGANIPEDVMEYVRKGEWG